VLHTGVVECSKVGRFGRVLAVLLTFDCLPTVGWFSKSGGTYVP